MVPRNSGEVKKTFLVYFQKNGSNLVQFVRDIEATTERETCNRTRYSNFNNRPGDSLGGVLYAEEKVVTPLSQPKTPVVIKGLDAPSPKPAYRRPLRSAEWPALQEELPGTQLSF